MTPVEQKHSHAVPRFGRMDVELSAVEQAMQHSSQYLMSRRHEEGYWNGELESDAMLVADYIFLHTLLETGDRGKMERALRRMMQMQQADGSWNIFPGAPGNISQTVKCYSAAKMMGMSADDPRLAKAREWALAHGGVVACNTFTKMYLCAVGMYDYDAVPAVPPEIILFPRWFYFNIYEISSWSRGILVPLSILYAKKPFKKLSAEQGIDELFVGGRANSNLRLRFDRKKLISWRNFFICTDRLMHWAEAVHIRPLRRLALKKAEEWMLERFEMTDGLHAIYPAMLNSIIALRCLGYSEDDPQVIRARDEFEKLGIEEGPTEDCAEPTFRMVPCMSPVWDTAQAITALGDAGISRTDPEMLKSVDWMLDREIRHKGDWAFKVKDVEPGGWAFEFNNEFYPDTDDTAQVLLALSKVDNPRSEYQQRVVDRAIAWEFAMQSKNGGWASFDKDNTKMIFQYIPFADHNAMLDPPTVDITGRMLEMLAAYGYTTDDKRIQKAIEFILSEQEPDGSWFGRWGVNYIYGTFLVLRGLECIGFDKNEPQVQQAAEWLRSIQNADGGWGESCWTYDDPDTRGVGESTPSQTAWALMGLISAGDDRSDSVANGVRWLVQHQEADGSWDESTRVGGFKQAIVTGTGFPKVYYLAYTLYRQYFPLMALSAYKRMMETAAR